METKYFSVGDFDSKTNFVKVPNLLPIKKEDLIFSGEMDDDRTCTDLSLSDYDWASYNLATKFRTKENGVLRVQWNHFLTSSSLMMVTQLKDRTLTYYYIEFDSKIFGKYFKEFLSEHIRMWDDEYAFNGGEVVIKFFNEVLEKGNLAGIAKTDKKVPLNLYWMVNDNEDFEIRKKIEEINSENKI